jgi:5'-nucleotidase
MTDRRTALRKILVVNDDGIGAEGIAYLASLAKHFGEVYVVAPAEQNSAMSQRVIIHSDFHVREVSFPVADVKAWSLDGTPADCVKHGVNAILGFRPDIVFSGINFGYNAGIDILYSGTVGACMEALVQGIPAIAYSLDKVHDYRVPEMYFDSITERLLNTPIGKNEIFSVNFPGCAPEKVQGVMDDVPPTPREERKPVRYRLTGEPDGSRQLSIEEFFSADWEEGTDLWALSRGYITVQKLRNMVIPPEGAAR